MAEFKSIIYEKVGPVVRITLNRPEKLNPLSMWGEHGEIAELSKACQMIKEDDEVKVFIIKGAGRAFSAGYDQESADRPKEHSSSVSGFVKSNDIANDCYIRAIWENPKVSIAQVHGYCLVAGSTLAAFCDITIAAEDAIFGYPAVRFVSTPSSNIWPFFMSPKQFNEFFFTGNFFTAQEMKEMGLVNRIVPRDKLDEEVEKMAQTIVKVPQESITGSKILKRHVYGLWGFEQIVRHGALIDGIQSIDSPFYQEWRKILTTKGLKEALKWRDAKFAGTDIRPELRARRYDKKK